MSLTWFTASTAGLVTVSLYTVIVEAFVLVSLTGGDEESLGRVWLRGAASLSNVTGRTTGEDCIVTEGGFGWGGETTGDGATSAEFVAG